MTASTSAENRFGRSLVWPAGAALLCGLVVLLHLAVVLVLRQRGGSAGATAKDLASLVGSVLAAAALLFAAYHARRTNPLVAAAWGLLAVAQVFDLLGNVVWINMQAWFHQATFPSLADLLYLCFYPFFALGILRLSLVPFTRSERLKLLLEMGTVMLGAILVYWAFIFGPMLGARRTNLLTLPFTLAYPVGDLALLWALLWLLPDRAPAHERAPVMLLAASTACLIVTDTLYGYESLAGTYRSGGFLDLGWTLSAVLLALAGVTQATWPPAGEPEDLVEPELELGERIQPWGDYLPYLGLAAAYGLLLWNRDHPLAMSFPALAVGVAGIITLLLVRQAVALQDNVALNQAAQREIAERKRAEAALSQREVSLEEALRALEQARDQLELRVRERTAQLVSANEALHVEVVQHQRSEASLRESEERFRQLADNVNEVFWLRDAQTSRMLYINSAHEKVTGWPAERLMDDPLTWLEMIHPDDRARVDMIMTGQVQFPLDIEHRIVRPDGTVRWVRTRLFHVFDTTGLPYRMAGIMEDDTERREREEALRQTQKLESIGLLAGGVAHDFNNLLTAILAYADLALSQLEPDHIAVDYINKSLRSAERAADLTRQLLAYAGKGHFHVEDLDLNLFLNESVALLTTAVPKNVEIRLDLAPALPVITADRGQVQQVVMNLVLNAAEATVARGGMVTIRTTTREVNPNASAGPWMATAAPSPGSYACLEVMDQGDGMSPETISRIFDPFFTTKTTGRGLGLAAVLGIVRAQHGGLAVDSRPGRGTCFTVLFPISSGSPADGTSDCTGLQVTSATAGEEALILVIDDEVPVREALTDGLETAGFRVLVAADGTDGLEVFRQFRSQIDLVVLDMLMPGIGGDETLHALREIDPQVKIILSSGYDQAETARRLAARHISDRPTDFLQKPYGLSAVIAKVRQCLGSPPKTPQI